MSDWGQGAKNNDIGWGQGAVNNDISWGAVHADSWAGDTDIVGLDPAQAIINAFKTRVLADGGTFEAEQCLKDSLPALIENEPSLLVTPNAVEAGKLFSIIPTDGAADLDVVRNTTATYVGADGLIKTALANEPRLDYTNGSCPSILVEPQRTNLLLQSNNFTIGNWTKTNATVTANAIISPDGTMNASRVTATGISGMTQSVIMTNGVTYTISCWIKSAGTGKDTLRLIQQTNRVSNVTATNEWVRYTYTFTNTYATGTQTNGISRDSLNNDFDIFLYGFELEVGSNATSYIPTTTATVTRNADVISKSGLTGITTITETFENGTTNVITGIPTSYTMSQGRIKNVIGL